MGEADQSSGEVPGGRVVGKGGGSGGGGGEVAGRAPPRGRAPFFTFCHWPVAGGGEGALKARSPSRSSSGSTRPSRGGGCAADSQACAAGGGRVAGEGRPGSRSEEHTSEHQSHYSISYSVFCL